MRNFETSKHMLLVTQDWLYIKKQEPNPWPRVTWAATILTMAASASDEPFSIKIYTENEKSIMF